MAGGAVRVIVGADAFSVAGISQEYSSTAGRNLTLGFAGLVGCRAIAGAVLPRFRSNLA